MQLNQDDPIGTVRALLATVARNQAELETMLGLGQAAISKLKKKPRIPDDLFAMMRELMPPEEQDPADAHASIHSARLTVDPAIQQRAVHFDEATVDAYAELLERDHSWPFSAPVDAFEADGKLIVSDGFHRLEAVARVFPEGLDVPVRIHTGGEREALAFAIGANDAHGLPRTAADKRKAVRTILADEEWSQLSDRAIAGMAKVGNRFVGDVRRELESKFTVPGHSDAVVPPYSEMAAKNTPKKAVRKGRDGRRTNTSNIGRKPKQQPPTAKKTELKPRGRAVEEFAQACQEVRVAPFTEPEVYQIAMRARDTLKWCLTHIDPKGRYKLLEPFREPNGEVVE